MARVALDAMGGDRAPAETVAGALDAASAGVDVVLVGDPDALVPLLPRPDALPIVAASEVVGMDEEPVRALRRKADSSIAVCARLVAEGGADAYVSAGSTGAAMAAAALLLGRLPGVLRPAIASLIPTPEGPTVLIDSGANPECRAEHLHQFALMGSLVADLERPRRRSTSTGDGAGGHADDRPRVGLLNIGEEEGKGRDLEKATFDRLAADPRLRFVGNVEGRDLGADRADVFVTDGFTGNVVLKTAEGVAQFVMRVAAEVFGDLAPDVQAALVPALVDVRRRLDWETTGGAYLVGVRGVVVIAHGASSRRAIAAAIRMAADAADRGLVARIASALTEATS